MTPPPLTFTGILAADWMIALYLGSGVVIALLVLCEVGVYLWRQHRIARCRRECNRIHAEMRRAAARRVIS